MPEQAAQQLLSSRQFDRYQHLAAQTYADRNPLMQWCTACPTPCLLTALRTQRALCLVSWVCSSVHPLVGPAISRLPLPQRLLTQLGLQCSWAPSHNHIRCVFTV